MLSTGACSSCSIGGLVTGMQKMKPELNVRVFKCASVCVCVSMREFVCMGVWGEGQAQPL